MWALSCHSHEALKCLPPDEDDLSTSLVSQWPKSSIVTVGMVTHLLNFSMIAIGRPDAVGFCSFVLMQLIDSIHSMHITPSRRLHTVGRPTALFITACAINTICNAIVPVPLAI